MCGIAGIIGNNHDSLLISTMIRRMKHRGPDAEGYYQNDNVELGHCRLAIKDLSDQAKQPFISLDRKVAVIVNGEIYNYEELKNPLVSKGYIFQSESDCETILHAYLDGELNFIPKLNGMYAIGIWDGSQNTLFLVRDRLGIKPLYYSVNQDFFIFASEIKAIAACPKVNLSLDLQSFSEYLAFENIFSNRTLNNDIKLVEPGEIVKFNLSNFSISRDYYWNPQICNSDDSDHPNVYDNYSQIIESSVARHLMSDVPLGCYLSSGIDSSSVVYWASTLLNKNIKTYTGDFGISGYYDEAQPAKKIAEYFGCDNIQVDIQPSDFAANIEKIVYHLDEPRVGAGSFSQYMVAKRAAKDLKVILTGHGGDEFFAGYPVFKAIFGRNNLFQLLFTSTFRELVVFFYFSVFSKFKKEIKYFLPNIFSSNTLKVLLKDDFYNSFQDNSNCALELERFRDNTIDDYERLFYTYLKLYLPSLFIVEDKISMAFSLESRTPLCDNELLQLALSIPLSQKLTNFELKHVPRVSMRDKLPGFIYHLPKRGFPTPIKRWFKNELKGFVKSYILDNYKEIDYFKKSKVEKLISKFQNSSFTTPYDEIKAHRLWILLNLVIYNKIQRQRYQLN